MESLCLAPTTGNAFLSGVLAYIDCQAQTLGSFGYAALASPASPALILFSLLLTLFIAGFGLRMLTGQPLSTPDLIGAALKVGIALALASSWGAYRVVVYDTILKGPGELVATMGNAAGLPGAEGGLVARLQGVDSAIVALTLAGTGRLDPSLVSPTASAEERLRPPFADDLAFGLGRMAFLSGILASLGFVRTLAALLLALGPLFAGLLLFEATRGLFMGWARLLLGTALASLGATLILMIELGLLEPWLANALALRAARLATPSAPVELLVMTLSFAAILIGMIGVAVRLVLVPVINAAWSQRPGAAAAVQRDPAILPGQPRLLTAEGPVPSRAVRVADAVAAQDRRALALAGAVLAPAGAVSGSRSPEPRGALTVAGITPLGQSYRRATIGQSASAEKRNARS
jgi:type IV secretion system protein VirB6